MLTPWHENVYVVIYDVLIIDVSKIDENHFKQTLASLPCLWVNR